VDSKECLVRIGDSYTLSAMDTSEVFTIFTFPETPVCMVSVYSNVASNSSVSVSERKTLDFIIYPIPANKQLNVSFGENITGEVRLIISDMTGRVVYSGDINDVRPGQIESINSINLKEGLYILRLASGENNAIRKILIKR
jgi:hypothetical protein